MTWSQIQKAVEESGITEKDAIIEIHCQLHDGEQTFRKIKLGNFVKLAEEESESARRRETSGSAC